MVLANFEREGTSSKRQIEKNRKWSRDLIFQEMKKFCGDTVGPIRLARIDLRYDVLDLYLITKMERNRVLEWRSKIIQVWIISLKFPFPKNIIRNRCKILVERVVNISGISGHRISILDTWWLIKILWLDVHYLFNSFPNFFQVILIVSKIVFIEPLLPSTSRISNLVSKFFF